MHSNNIVTNRNEFTELCELEERRNSIVKYYASLIESCEVLVIMHIVYTTNIFSDGVGGSEYIFWLYAKYMAKKGHKINVICFKRDQSSLTRLGQERNNIDVIELVPEAVHRGVLFQDIISNVKYIEKGLQVVRECCGNIDVVHSNTYIPAAVGGVAKMLLKAGHVLTIHDVGSTMGLHFIYSWFREGENNSLSSYIKALAGFFYENLLINLIPKDAILVPSKATLHDVKRINPKDTKIYVIPNFLDEELYESYKSKFRVRYEPCILYIGRLVFYKNVHTLVKSFSQVLQHKRDAILIIIGRGPLYKPIYDWIYRHELQKNILMLGGVDQEEKLRYLSQCSATVNLSIFEGFGLTTLESWYFEKPVIVSNIPPLNEIVDNGLDGFVVDLKDKNSLVNTVIRLLDSQLARKMGSRGFHKVLNQYSSNTIVHQLEAIYKTL